MSQDILDFAEEIMNREGEVIPLEYELAWLQGSLLTWNQEHMYNPEERKAAQATFDNARATAARMLTVGKPLPDWLASFVVDVMYGRNPRPATRGKDPNPEIMERDYRLSEAVSAVALRYGLQKYTNNELSDSFTAADYVAAATGEKIATVIKAVQKSGG